MFQKCHNTNVKKLNSTDAIFSTLWDVIVIGGGPAGMMAAGRAAERGLSVLLLEKNEDVGKKLLTTGGGRSNVTNAEFDTRVLLSKFKDSSKFLFSPFSSFGVKESLAFFNKRGMPTKIEPEKRVFPVSDSAESVKKVLIEYMKEHGVTVRSNMKVSKFSISESGTLDGVLVGGKKIIRGKNIVLATGGKSHPETGSTGDGFDWLKDVGHTITEPSVSLVPITVEDSWVKKLSGVSLRSAKISLYQNGVKQAVHKGKILFTHFGLSGPAALNMSGEVGELLKYGDLALSLDLLPAHDYATLNKALLDLFEKRSNALFKNVIDELIPKAFVPVILEKSAIEASTPCHSVSREARLNLVKLLKDIPMRPTGLLGADKAIITSGGVSLNEIDMKTMRSVKVPNLYLVGDILNIDRPSGGYSLQLCWTTGWVAGSAI